MLDATNQLKPSGKTADAVHELFEKVCERDREAERERERERERESNRRCSHTEVVLPMMR